jgi:GT2 family glycosyltransferase
MINKRIERIVDLITISKNIIKDYGLAYFLKIATSEIKEYKLDILKPNEQKKIITSLDQDHINYNNWIIEQKNQFKKLSVIKNEDMDNFAIIISIESHNMHLLENTLKSIEIQKIQNLNIFLQNSNQEEKIRNLIDEKVRKYNLKLFETKLKDHFQYIVFVSSGDQFIESSFFDIQNAIKKKPNAEIIYFDEDENSELGRINPYFKPDWSPELFLSMDYISNSYIIKNTINTEIIFEEINFKKNWKFEILLKLIDKSIEIIHIDTIVISINTINLKQKNVRKNYEKGLEEKFFDKKNIDTKITIDNKGLIKINYKLKNYPKVSIVIPTKNNRKILERCLKSIKKNNYNNYEIIIIDNNSDDEKTIAYLNKLPFKIIKFKKHFNFAAMNNLAVKETSGEYILFMNDDVAALDKEWLSEMISICQLENIGIVGPKLVLKNNKLQHAGIALLENGAGFHPMMGGDSYSGSNHVYANTMKNCVAVTGACLLIKKNLFEKVNGFDEIFDLYYNDVDLCLKIQKLGFKVAYTPYVKLLHEGSKTIKQQTANTGFYAIENHQSFYEKWKNNEKLDPYYNKNLGYNFKIRSYKN